MPVRRGRGAGVPAHVHAPAQRVHHFSLRRLSIALEQGPMSLASLFTYRVSLPNQRNTAPVLVFLRLSPGQPPCLG